MGLTIMKYVRHVPLLFIVFLIYNAIAFFSPSGVGSFTAQVFSFKLVSGATLALTLGDFLFFLGLIFLFFELIKATRSSASAVLDHALSTLMFVVFLVEFLIVKSAGTSSFLILMLLALVDVIAGFTISLQGARRDVLLERS